MDVVIQLPDEIKAFLAVFVTLFVTELLKIVGEKLGVNLSGYAAQLTASTVAAILVLINALFSNIPAEFIPVAQSLMGLVVVILGSFGAYKVFFKR